MSKIYLSSPGLICCAGQNKNELYESCINGSQKGIVIKKLPCGGQFPIRQIPENMPDIKAPFNIQDTAAYALKTRALRIINASIEQIRNDIEKVISEYGEEKIGVCLGTCDNGSEASLIAHEEFITSGSFPKDYNLRFQSASFSAEFIASKFGIKGPVMTVATACASGASAIARGAELIRSGLCKAVIAGGADIVSDTVLFGFHALEALSDEISNPFSKNRKGINLGEGAAFFLLTSSPLCSSTQADSGTSTSAIELLAYGESSDAYHMTAPGQDGAGPARAMKSALLEAGLEASDIAYVNLHGTGTPLNDKAEALAMKTVFDDYTVQSSSTKPLTGHTLGAAGALEAALCWMALYEKKGFPMHCWDREKDDELVFYPYISESTPTTQVPLAVKQKACMTNSFAFGGCNVSLILGYST